MPRLPRHVALNALFYDPGRSGGTETYLRGLVPALARAAPDLRLTLVTTRRGHARLAAEGWGDFCELVSLRSDEGQRARRLAGELAGVEHVARSRGCDVLHSLIATGPVWSRTPVVATLHDLTFLHESTFRLSTTLALSLLITNTVRRAAQVVTVSDATREEALRRLRLDPSRVRTVHNGAGRATEAVAPARADGARSLVLCVAALRPHKNQAQLVRAAAELPHDLAVAFCGPREPYADEVEALARELGVDDRVRVYGYVADDELDALWAQAACAAFPTRAEGFGLPVLEAMARDVPVACADIPVLREVGGDVAHYFPLDDPGATARAILTAREDRSGRGPARAARFTWDACAAGTLEAYERACTSA